jgi:hypothetical protein
MSLAHEISGVRLQAEQVRLQPDATTGSDTVLVLCLTTIIPGIGLRLPLS